MKKYLPISFLMSIMVLYLVRMFVLHHWPSLIHRTDSPMLIRKSNSTNLISSYMCLLEELPQGMGNQIMTLAWARHLSIEQGSVLHISLSYWESVFGTWTYVVNDEIDPIKCDSVYTWQHMYLDMQDNLHANFDVPIPRIEVIEAANEKWAAYPNDKIFTRLSRHEDARPSTVLFCPSGRVESLEKWRKDTLFAELPLFSPTEFVNHLDIGVQLGMMITANTLVGDPTNITDFLVWKMKRQYGRYSDVMLPVQCYSRFNPDAEIATIVDPVNTSIYVHNPTHCRYISQSLLLMHSWEPDRQLAILNSLKESGGAFLDIGANIGVFSLVVAKAGHQVIAVEPLQYNWELLQASAVLEGVDIHLLKVAAGVQAGSVCMEPAWLGSPTINKGNGQVTRDSACTNSVRMERIDRLLNPNICIGAVKVDVEGFEALALKGAEGILWSPTNRCQPWLILVEYIREYTEIAGGADDLAQLMDSKGYDCGQRIHENGDYICRRMRDR